VKPESNDQPGELELIHIWKDEQAPSTGNRINWSRSKRPTTCSQAQGLQHMNTDGTDILKSETENGEMNIETIPASENLRKDLQQCIVQYPTRSISVMHVIQDLKTRKEDFIGSIAIYLDATCIILNDRFISPPGLNEFDQNWYFQTGYLQRLYSRESNGTHRDFPLPKKNYYLTRNESLTTKFKSLPGKHSTTSAFFSKPYARIPPRPNYLTGRNSPVADSTQATQNQNSVPNGTSTDERKPFARPPPTTNPTMEPSTKKCRVISTPVSRTNSPKEPRTFADD